MRELVLDDEQATVVCGSTEEVLVRDRRGMLLGHLRPALAPADAAHIEEAKRRLASNQPRYTTAQVIGHSLGSG